MTSGTTNPGVLETDSAAIEAMARAAFARFVRPRRHTRPAWEAALLATGERLTLASGLAATSWGAGPTILLVHGWEGRGAQLGAFVAPLVAVGRRVVALDGPAHGDSPGEECDPVTLARAVAATAAEIGPLAAVVAHSMGAASTAIALSRGMAAGRVVLIGAPLTMRGPIDRFARVAGLTWPVADRFRALVAERAGAPPEDLAFDRLGPRLTTPALIVHDRDDRDVPFVDAERIAESWPGARLLATSGLGHRRILRDPGVVAEAAAFLSGEAPPLVSGGEAAG